MDPEILSLFTIAGSGIAAYFGAYFKRKGEDQAMREGFAEVLRQTKQTTQATKDIEAKITDKVWDRQKRWELKRDILLEAIKRIVAIDDVLTTYKSFIDLDVERLPQGGELDTLWAQRKLEKTREWNVASTNFDETCAIVDVVCSPELKKLFEDLARYTKFAAMHLSKGHLQRWAEFQMETFGRIKRAQSAIRRELGVDSATSQSNESSATPNPAPQNPEAK